MEMNRKTRFNIGYWIVAVFILMAIQYFLATATQVAQIPYSQFETDLRDGKIAEVAVSDNFIQGRYKQPQNERPYFITTRVEPDLAQQLQSHGVVVTGQIESTFLRDLLSWLIPVALFVGVWMFMLRRMGGGVGGGLMQIGKSKAKIYVQSDTGVTFKDVAGVDEAKEELKGHRKLNGDETSGDAVYLRPLMLERSSPTGSSPLRAVGDDGWRGCRSAGYGRGWQLDHGWKRSVADAALT